MSISQVSVCNSALINVGADRISSIDESTRRAVLLKAIYALTRDAVLRAHPWNFAIKRVTLAPSDATPAFKYDYAYDLPADCLRVLNVFVDDDDDVDWVAEDSQILTDESAIDVLYIFRQDDESTWDSCFAEALGWALSSKVAYALTQSMTLAQGCDAKYKAVLAEARSMDGAEGVIPALEADEWIRARKR